MKAIVIITAALGLASLLFLTPVHAESGPTADNDRPNQWVSHQMNQPRPELGKVRRLSRERLEDIRKLYELAKKEAEALAKDKASPPK